MAYTITNNAAIGDGLSSLAKLFSAPASMAVEADLKHQQRNLLVQEQALKQQNYDIMQGQRGQFADYQTLMQDPQWEDPAWRNQIQSLATTLSPTGSGFSIPNGQNLAQVGTFTNPNLYGNDADLSRATGQSYASTPGGMADAFKYDLVKSLIGDIFTGQAKATAAANKGSNGMDIRFGTSNPDDITVANRFKTQWENYFANNSATAGAYIPPALMDQLVAKTAEKAHNGENEIDAMQHVLQELGDDPFGTEANTAQGGTLFPWDHKDKQVMTQKNLALDPTTPAAAAPAGGIGAQAVVDLLKTFGIDVSGIVAPDKAAEVNTTGGGGATTPTPGAATTAAVDQMTGGGPRRDAVPQPGPPLVAKGGGVTDITGMSGKEAQAASAAPDPNAKVSTEQPPFKTIRDKNGNYEVVFSDGTRKKVRPGYRSVSADKKSAWVLYPDGWKKVQVQ